MKAYDYYNNNTIPYPNKNDFKRFNVFDRDKVLGTGLVEREMGQAIEQCPNATITSYYLKEEYQAQLKAHNARERELLEEFKADLFEEFDVTDNPKANKAYDIAWEHGHSYGLSEIYNYFSDLVELIQ